MQHKNQEKQRKMFHGIHHHISFSKSKGQVIKSCDTSHASHVMNQVTSQVMGQVHVT
jgi:hypothetical protein